MGELDETAAAGDVAVGHGEVMAGPFTAESQTVQPIERFSQEVQERLKFERDTVIGCSNELEGEPETGARITLVAECVVTRLCPNATAGAAAPPPAPSYCANFRVAIRPTISEASRPVATDEEAAAAAAAAAEQGLDGLVLRVPEVYRHNKELYEAEHPQTVRVVQRLLALAYTKMIEPIATIPDKAFTPDNGDKRTYVSLATYCWPSNPDDLKNPKGPWECKDGLPFPGRNIIAPDFEKLMTTQTKVLVLASAYYFSGEEVFAQRAAATLRAFYTDPDTGMRPTLKYAQLRAGSKKGATTGTIDNHSTYAVFDAVALLQGSAAWTQEDQAALVQWFSEYIQHLQSDHCRKESLQENNHGTFFDVQYLAILSFLRRREDAVDFIENVVRPRLRAQIAGAVMATEMTRPKSYSYHSFILEGYVQLAMMADKFGINLWDMSADTGNSMLDAWDWMVPHWCDRSESIWPVEQINNPKLDLNRPQEYTGAVYTHVMAAEAPGDAYTLRGRHYALLYQSLRGGPDPKHEMDEGRALIRQLGLVKFDDCFITFCPERAIVAVDPPAYPAANCIPSLDTPLPALDATKGPFYHVKTASDILPALAKGDPPGAMLDINTWLGPSAAARAARMRYMASTKIAAHSAITIAAVLCVLAAVVAAALRSTLRAARKERRA